MNGQLLELTDDNFGTEVGAGTGLVVVDFWAPWCAPCRFIAPIVEKLADELQGRVKVGKLDVDENPRTANRYGIQSIPTIGIFEDGELVDSVVGAISKMTLRTFIERKISANGTMR